MNALAPDATASTTLRSRGDRPPPRSADLHSKRAQRAAAIPEPEPGVDEVQFFFKLIKECDNPDTLTLLARAVGGELAPHELRRLYQRVEKRCPEATTALLRQKAPGWMLFQRKEPAEFNNTRISSHARLFEAHGAERSERVLLVLFTGRLGELFMPVSRLLARLPFARFDVLRLRADNEGEYPCGVPGLGNSFRAVCDDLHRRAEGYAGAAAVGTSLGGFPALRAAVLADLAVGLSFAGRFTKFDPALTALDVASYDPLCACTRPSRTRLLAYFSVQNRIDTANAEMLTKMYPTARLFPVADSADHNVMAQMVVSGQLDRLFAELDVLARDSG